MALEKVKRKIRQGEYQFSHHAEVERENESVTVDDIKTAVINGELLEDYAHDPRGASCLVLGMMNNGRPLHVVLTMLSLDVVLFITVYIPTLPKWLDPSTRRPKGGF